MFLQNIKSVANGLKAGIVASLITEACISNFEKIIKRAFPKFFYRYAIGAGRLDNILLRAPISATVIMLPIIEEVAFRYGVQKHLNSALEKSSSEFLKKNAFQITAVASSVLFGLVHMVDPKEWGGVKEAVLIQAIYAGAVGFFSLSKTYKEHGLLGSIASHITFNAMGIINIKY